MIFVSLVVQKLQQFVGLDQILRGSVCLDGAMRKVEERQRAIELGDPLG